MYIFVFQQLLIYFYAIFVTTTDNVSLFQHVILKLHNVKFTYKQYMYSNNVVGSDRIFMIIHEVYFQQNKKYAKQTKTTGLSDKQCK